MSTPTRGKENIALSPFQLSPAPKVCQSPHGVAYDILIKPASAKKLVTVVNTPPSKDPTDKLKSAEKRKEHMDFEAQEKNRQRHEKLKAAKCHVLASIENHQKQTIAKVQKKEETTEELKLRKEKELEDKRLAREQRAQEARKIYEENLESKRKSTIEAGLSKCKLAEELREANLQAIADKAKKDLMKVDNTLAAQKKKQEELDEKIRQDLLNKEEIRLKHLSSIKETCGNHVKDAKNRANMCLKERN